MNRFQTKRTIGSQTKVSIPNIKDNWLPDKGVGSKQRTFVSLTKMSAQTTKKTVPTRKKDVIQHTRSSQIQELFFSSSNKEVFFKQAGDIFSYSNKEVFFSNKQEIFFLPQQGGFLKNNQEIFSSPNKEVF